MKGFSEAWQQNVVPWNLCINQPNASERIGDGGSATHFASVGQSEVPPIENDGIVTAEEVGGLKLEVRG
jgi:hypothetical protein